MNGRDGYSSDSGAGHEPSEERGQAAWSARPPGSVPPWASAETQAGQSPPWASAETHTNGTRPPNWPPPPPPPPGAGHFPGPATAPTPVAAPAPRRGARGLLLALAVVAVVGAGAGAGAWYLTRDHSTGAGAGPATSVSVTVSGTPSQSPTPSPTLTPSASTLASSPPSLGYHRTQDPVGYTIDVRDGWTRRQKTGKLAPIVFYDDPGGDRQLEIFEVTESTPYKSLTLAETDPGYGFAGQPGYQVVERDHGDTWAELVYRYDDTEKGARQVIDHRFAAADGTLYAIRSSGPADLDPAQVREPLKMAVRSFCPAGAQCT